MRCRINLIEQAFSESLRRERMSSIDQYAQAYRLAGLRAAWERARNRIAGIIHVGQQTTDGLGQYTLLFN